MQGQARLQKIIRRMGYGLSGFILLLILLSTICVISVCWKSRSGIGLGGGFIVWVAPGPHPERGRYQEYWTPHLRIQPMDWSKWDASWWTWFWPQVEFEPDAAITTIPLGTALLVVSVPTVLWGRLNFRRFPPGHCRACGYNLTGNVSGRCPECSTVCSDLKGA